jgi:3-oxoadipate enol-lactonase
VRTATAANGLAFDDDPGSAPPRDGRRPVVLIHAAICDRRMWDGLLAALSGRRIVRMDLRGFGDSTSRPHGPFSHHGDVAGLMDELGVRAAHLVGVSMGAAVAAEIAIGRPELARSLLLVAPGGALMAGPSEELEAFWEAEETALEAGDIDAAVEANLRTWVDGPARAPSDVDPELRALVGVMQKRAFELTADWTDVDERLLEPRARERLAEIAAPTLVLAGAGDLAVIRDTAQRIGDGVAGARLVEWPAVGHLPPLERPAEFVRLAAAWFDEAEQAGP